MLPPVTEWVCHLVASACVDKIFSLNRGRVSKRKRFKHFLEVIRANVFIFSSIFVCVSDGRYCKVHWVSNQEQSVITLALLHGICPHNFLHVSRKSDLRSISHFWSRTLAKKLAFQFQGFRLAGIWRVPPITVITGGGGGGGLDYNGKVAIQFLIW